MGTSVRTASSLLWISAQAERWSEIAVVGTVVPVQRTLANVAGLCVGRAQCSHCKPQDRGTSVTCLTKQSSRRGETNALFTDVISPRGSLLSLCGKKMKMAVSAMWLSESEGRVGQLPSAGLAMRRVGSSVIANLALRSYMFDS